jgi:hypothetical protein
MNNINVTKQYISYDVSPNTPNPAVMIRPIPTTIREYIHTKGDADAMLRPDAILRPDTDAILPFEPAYYTEQGVVLGPIRYNNLAVKTYVLHFQTTGTVRVFAVLNNTYNSTTEINHYSKAEIFAKLKKGEFEIGTITLGDQPDLIRHRTPYIHDDNSELRMHYTHPRNASGNVAWRSITWDLFADEVNKLNTGMRRRSR